jgi:hypothetical protein
MTLLRICLAAALACGLATAAAADPAEARATLEQACRDDGMATETCRCLGDFVEDNFSPREIEGAALVFADPELSEDPGVAIGTLLEEGYTLDEITAVAERVMSLEQAATTTCTLDGAAPDDAEGSGDD